MSYDTDTTSQIEDPSGALRFFRKGFNYSQDGSGNRLVYHLQGCNMRCPWCANPESFPVGGTLLVQPEWLTSAVCPHGAIKAKRLDRSKCADCKMKECIFEYRNKGITSSCTTERLDVLVKEVENSSFLFYDNGGVTLTGGEPTLQFDSVRAFLSTLKSLGINTAIETNATHPELTALFPLLDQLIMDFKHHDDESCKRYTGVGNARIKENIAKAFAHHQDVLIRIPVIGHVNDSDQDIDAFCSFFVQANPQHAAFEFLPYHEYGRSKWVQCGLPYKMEDAYTEEAQIRKFEERFRANGLKVVHT